MANRWKTIERDIRRHNRQHGFGDDAWTWNDSLDLSRGANLWDVSLWPESDEESVDAAFLVGFYKSPATNGIMFGNQSMLSLAFSSESGVRPWALRLQTPTTSESFTLDGKRAVGELAQTAAVAMIGAYGQSLQSQPGSLSVLAADHLASRRDQLLENTRTPEEQEELQSIQRALLNLKKFATRFEDSGRFWNWQGWNYRPQPWTFNPPSVQTHRGFSWSFDLTRYAPALSEARELFQQIVDGQWAQGLQQYVDQATNKLSR